ncbi:hypothetical protein [Streptomyces sp. NPDC017941]|uniref:hypothetical protein n=1 Tax=Streptomyces sp. NPDC017941 TaxID=3365018 RepID=UPI00378FABD4
MSATTAELDAAATRVYTTYMGHLHACPPCRRMDYCPKGTRLRRAWNAARGAAVRAHLNRTGGTRCGT